MIDLASVRVRIWSNEWRAYWRHEGCGYTERASDAWVLSLAEAYRVTAHCGPEKRIAFEPTREEPWEERMAG